MGADSGVDVVFKGKSPNLDICEAGKDSCTNVKFGKIEEVIHCVAMSVVGTCSSYGCGRWTIHSAIPPARK